MNSLYRFYLISVVTLALSVSGPVITIEAWTAQSDKSPVPTVETAVTIDVKNFRLSGEAFIENQSGSPFTIDVGQLILGAVSIDGAEITPSITDGRFRVTELSGDSILHIRFHRRFCETDLNKHPYQRHSLTGSYISPQGLVLLDNWCPTVDGLATYRLTALVPDDFSAVSEADTVTVTPSGTMHRYRFHFPHPRPGISLIAGPYRISTIKRKGLEISAYFFPEDQHMAAKYLEKSIYYLDLYERIVGPYPFRRFAIVQNRGPTGYGLSTYTLLGQEVTRLPFIVDTSLGHEILHSWFGNSVYVDPGQGNWSEGLTTYLADHLYEEQKGLGSEYRHQLLIDYQSYVHGEDVPSLSDFRSRTGRTDKAIGYGRSAMLFHMLKMRIGKPAFDQALKKFYSEFCFKYAGWNDIETIFARVSRDDLGLFFHQWLERTDVPVLSARIRDEMTLPGKKAVALELMQKNDPPYSVRVPVVLESSCGNYRHVVDFNTRKKTVVFKTELLPKKIILDPELELMRSLSAGEYPPALSRLFGAEEKYYVLNQDQQGIYGQFAAFLETLGFSSRSPDSISDHFFSSNTILFLGDHGPTIERLTGKTPSPVRGAKITVRANPFNSSQVFGTVKSSSREQLRQISRKLLHYGRYTSLTFRNGKIIDKETTPAASGIEVPVSGDSVHGIAAADLRTLQSIVDEISESTVIYAGEQHDLYSHHLTQLKIIKALHEKGHEISVGLEMFQQPYQNALDRFITGKTDEVTFLRETEYFERWRFDYRLYRPIISYCRKNRIPLVALNVPAEISRKVARQGLMSLTEEEQRHIPDDIDWTDTAYRDRLMEIFREHSSDSIQNFEYFYQAQVLWDETMAMNICSYLESHPGTKMVVLAGLGHIIYRSGIPDRVRRRSGYRQYILAMSSGDSLESDLADYFLFPKPVKAPFSARLGIIAKEEPGRIAAASVMPGSPADRAGMKAKDILLAFDGMEIRDLTDLKIGLMLKEEGDSAIVKVRRQRDLLPDTTIELSIGPFTSVRQAFHSPHKR